MKKILSEYNIKTIKSSNLFTRLPFHWLEARESYLPFSQRKFHEGVLVGKSVKDGYYSRTNLFQVWS